MQAEIFTKPHCPWCDKAKEVLNELNIPYTEFVVSAGFDEHTPVPNQQFVTKDELLSRFPQAKTVPQIWIDGVHIGGCADLQTQVAQGKFKQ